MSAATLSGMIRRAAFDRERLTVARARVLIARFRHKPDEHDTGYSRDGAEGEKRGGIAEMIDHLAGEQGAERGAIPIVVATAPCARLNRPLPRMMSAMTSGVSAP